MSTPENSGKIRLVHNVVDGPSLDLYLDGKQIMSNVGYSKVSDYMKVNPGSHTVEITPHREINRLASAQMVVVPEGLHTLIVGGDQTRPNTIGILVLQNSIACPQRGQTHVRFVHAAAYLPNLDLYVDGPIMLFRNVAYGSVGNPIYVPIQAKTYNMGLAPSGSTDLLTKPEAVELRDGQTYTLVTSGTPDSPKILVVKDTSDGICYVGESQVRV